MEPVNIWNNNYKLKGSAQVRTMGSQKKGGWNSGKWIDTGNQGKTDELIGWRGSEEVIQLIHFTKAWRSFLPQMSLQEKQQ